MNNEISLIKARYMLRDKMEGINGRIDLFNESNDIEELKTLSHLLRENTNDLFNDPYKTEVKLRKYKTEEQLKYIINDLSQDFTDKTDDLNFDYLYRVISLLANDLDRILYFGASPNPNFVVYYNTNQKTIPSEWKNITESYINELMGRNEIDFPTLEYRILCLKKELWNTIAT
ncbi:hypothetical protein C3K47_15540 [Solitalea longa]|uniref:Uncharacterized protein n=1 Tax=Solitalea longa TaxID=2079460 RepID=A0A2S4ZYP3_9SPHI|nr:hypothetical protein [Solitalea longa]POY35471.1 hypothetical protein C3K47_15540 [Solitalea longa]